MKDSFEDIEKICDVAFNCLGYGFVGRQNIINHIINIVKTKEQAVEEVIRLYHKDNFPDEKEPCSNELFIELRDKILESENDLKIFINYVKEKIDKEIYVRN